MESVRSYKPRSMAGGHLYGHVTLACQAAPHTPSTQALATYSPRVLEQVVEDKHFKAGLRTWHSPTFNHTQARKLWKTELVIRVKLQ